MKKTSIFILALALAIAGSCSKEKESPDITLNPKTPPPPPPGKEWSSGGSSAAKAFLTSYAPAPQTTEFKASDGGSVTSNGMTLTFAPDIFTKADGTPYSGQVHISMSTVKDISGMMFTGVTTTAYGGELIISDGMFRLEAKDDASNDLKLAPGATYEAKFQSADPDAVIFVDGKVNNPDNKVSWVLGDSSMRVFRNPDGSVSTFLSEMFSWCNLDRFMNETPLTDISIKVPEGFGNTNTSCFLMYTGETAGAYLPVNVSLKAFSTVSSYYKVVKGRSARIICVAVVDGKHFLQVKQVNSIEENSTITMDNLVETTEAGIITALKAL